VRALQLYGTREDERIERAGRWLRAATPRTTEDRAMQLLGLTWAKAAAEDIRTSTKALLAEQRQDGGWAQLPTLGSRLERWRRARCLPPAAWFQNS